jgi:Bacterial Ig domain
MKKIYWILLLTGICATGHLQAQIASFNLSAAAAPVTGWTNVAGNASDSVVTATAGGITISSVATANWSPYAGTCAVNGYGAYPGTYFPVGVMSNGWYQYNGSAYSLALYNAGMPQFKLTGLNPDSTYILRMSGSNGAGFDDNPTVYTVAGTSVYASQNLNAGGNTSQGVTFTAIRPDDTGTIRIYVNCNSGTQLAAINGIQIFPGSAQVGTPTVAITAPTNGTIISEGGNLAIQATASEPGQTITKVEFYADTTKIGEVDAAPYNFTWVGPDPGPYELTAKATDNVGTINTASINVDVTSLNYYWSTTGNIGNNGDSNFVGNVDSVRLGFRTKNIERLSILPTGNVGIGTITPTAQFHTTGTVRLAGLTSDSTKTRVLVSDTSGNLFYRSASSLGGHWLYLNGTEYDSADNIAIGTSNPQGYKFAVNGTAIFTKVKVKTAGTWPDYVFAKGYHLPDLKELEDYLARYRHLPDIASEAEVQRDGIDVGDHQAALLKKVEELTLYLIDENKKLQVQSDQMQAQSDQMKAQQDRLDRQQKEIDELRKLIAEKK